MYNPYYPHNQRVTMMPRSSPSSFMYQNPMTPHNITYPSMPANAYPLRSMPNPLSIPRGNNLLRSPLSQGVGSLTSKGTISKILSSTENVVATINQAIPIYQQVKPLWDNSKKLRTAIKRIFPFNNQKDDVQKEVYDNPEVVTQETKKETKKDDYVEDNNPHQPFF